MLTLTINDLDINKAMDKDAMIALTGGGRYVRIKHTHVKLHAHRRRNGKVDFHAHVRRETHKVRRPHIHVVW